MALKLTTDSATEPVTLADMKLFLRVDHTTEDTLISALIKSARRFCEWYTGRAFINQTWDLWLDGIPTQQSNTWWDGERDGHISIISNAKAYIELPRGPVSSVTSFYYYTQGGTQTLWASTNYDVDSISSPGRLIPKMGKAWPSDLRRGNSINITYVAGYGSAASDVPADILDAIKLTCAHLFEHRGDSTESPPKTAKVLLNPYKVIKL